MQDQTREVMRQQHRLRVNRRAVEAMLVELERIEEPENPEERRKLHAMRAENRELIKMIKHSSQRLQDVQDHHLSIVAHVRAASALLIRTGIRMEGATGPDEYEDLQTQYHDQEREVERLSVGEYVHTMILEELQKLIGELEELSVKPNREKFNLEKAKTSSKKPSPK